MLATCICLNGSLLDQLSCTIVYLHNLFTCKFGRINMSVCLSVYGNDQRTNSKQKSINIVLHNSKQVHGYPDHRIPISEHLNHLIT